MKDVNITKHVMEIEGKNNTYAEQEAWHYYRDTIKDDLDYWKDSVARTTSELIRRHYEMSELSETELEDFMEMVGN